MHMHSRHRELNIIESVFQQEKRYQFEDIDIDIKYIEKMIRYT